MDKIWLEQYPEGVPEFIDVDAYSSLQDLFLRSASQFGDRPAFSNLGKTLSFSETEQLTRQFAAYLTYEAGLKPGDRIAIMMPNLLQYPIALFAAFRAGLIVVNTNPLYTDRELRHQLSDSGAKAIVILENFAHTLADVIDDTDIELVITTKIADQVGGLKGMLVNFVVQYVKKMVPPFSLPDAVPYAQVLAKGAEHTGQFKDAELSLDDTAFLQYTGGTTGVSKGAALSHRNMLANLLQAEAWTAKDLQPSKEIFITALPLYHVFALTANALFSVKIGAKNILITNPRDLPAFVKELKKEPFSFITGVNTLYNAMLNTPGIEAVDFSNLKIALGGGMAVQKSVAEEWKALTGVTLLEAYGLTETSPAVTINPVSLESYNGMIGLPVSSTEVCVRDVEGNELGIGESGELCVRGPQVMKGYWNRPDETAKVLDEDGWLSTGDVAIINELGYVKLVDRIKDMVLVSGFNVYPNEVEDVLAANEKVLEAGVIGVADDTSGEVVKAYVVKKDDSLNETELKEWCREELTAYKCPKQYVFVDELPKSNVGKILRRELRELDKAT
uniref:Long-chain-fatty-acid--CoA ligase n=1 Tax=uncultured Thiotrichaceae bacterium TaxID=298394 RepID=A0A6S6UJY6_9GAMM|nr:MAG: Long-chain-fatty-acid--CoA ligase (EC [uncultured Thiotrichaceae bacterium]